MDKGVWKEVVGEDAHQKVVGSCNRNERRIRAKKEEGVPIVKGRKRRSKRVCEGTTEKGIYSAIEITTNGASILRRKKEWEEEDGTGLPLSE